MAINRLDTVSPSGDNYDMNTTRTINGETYQVVDVLTVGGLAGWRTPNEAEDEQNDLMLVLEIDRERCLVESQLTGMTIKPTTRANVTELVGLVPA